MTRSLGLLLAALLFATGVSAQPDLSPGREGTLESEVRRLPKGKEALGPRVDKPPRRQPDLAPDAGQVQPPPAPDATGRVTRPTGLPSQAPGAEGVRSTLAKLLRVDGRTGSVDLRGRSPASARVEWQLEGSELAVILMRRDRAGCPAAGTSLDALNRQLQADRSVISFGGWSHSRGSEENAFDGLRYHDVTEFHVVACGIRGNALDGASTNAVRVLIGSVHRTLRLVPSRWFVAWSHRTEANAVCGLGVDSGAIAPPRGIEVGYVSRMTRGPGPVPCVRDRLFEYQPSASFDLSGLPRDARIVSAELRFAERDLERRSPSGRLCPAVTRSVGMSTEGVPATAEQVVEALSRSAEDERSPSSTAGSGRRLDVADWVRAWQGGREAGLTFLGLQGRHGDAACLGRIGDVRIDVEFD